MTAGQEKGVARAKRKFKVMAEAEIVAESEEAATETLRAYVADGALDFVTFTTKELKMTAFDEAVETMFT